MNDKQHKELMDALRGIESELSGLKDKAWKDLYKDERITELEQQVADLHKRNTRQALRIMKQRGVLNQLKDYAAVEGEQEILDAIDEVLE